MHHQVSRNKHGYADDGDCQGGQKVTLGEIWENAEIMLVATASPHPLCQQSYLILPRYSMAAIINATNQFKNIFNSSGYLLIMPSLVQVLKVIRVAKIIN